MNPFWWGFFCLVMSIASFCVGALAGMKYREEEAVENGLGEYVVDGKRRVEFRWIRRKL